MLGTWEQIHAPAVKGPRSSTHRRTNAIVAQHTNPIGTVCVNYAQILLDYVDTHKLSAAEVFGADWVSEMRTAPTGHRLPITQWEAAAQRAKDVLNDQALIVRLARHIQPYQLGLMGFMSMSFETLGEATATSPHYTDLIDDAYKVHWHIVSHHSVLTWHNRSIHACEDMLLLNMTLCVALTRQLTGRHDLRFEMLLRREGPAYPCVQQALASLLNGPVRFGQAANQLRFPSHYSEVRGRGADSKVHAALREQADASLSTLRDSTPEFMNRLQVLIEQRLAQGTVKLRDVACALDLVPRTLQHWLTQHGVTYRQLLNSVRCRQAERHLSDPRTSLSEVASLLGFADQSSFQHAFKRWKGAPPGTYRIRKKSDCAATISRLLKYLPAMSTPPWVDALSA